MAGVEVCRDGACLVPGLIRGRPRRRQRVGAAPRGAPKEVAADRPDPADPVHFQR